MKRLIKFRAWDKSTNAMIYFDLTDIYKKELAQGHYQTMIKEVCFEHPVYGVNPDIILMQYTGLHDSKGTEIYEGDIVDFPETKGCSVYFEKGAFMITNPWGNKWLLMQNAFNCEVIGNIHEGGTPNE